MPISNAVTSTARATGIEVGLTVLRMAVFPIIKAHASKSSPSRRDRPGQAGAGDARRRAMSDRIACNDWRDMATSATWNVT